MGPVKQQRVPVSQVKNPQSETIVGLTTIKGEDVEFDLVPSTGGKTAGRTGGVYEDSAVRGLVKGAEYRIPIDQVQRLWVMRRGISTGRTVALVGILGGTAAVIAVAVANRPKPQPTTTTGGCPFLYSWDGHQFVFDAELFGGAVARGMQRDDYSELPHLQTQHGIYRVLLADELEETDYTDRLELWTVDHPAGSSVGIDDSGNIYSLRAPQPPLSARDENGADLLPWLGATDRRIWEPLPAEAPDGQLRHEIVLTFPKPAGTASTKLLVHAGTGEWGLRMFNSLFELYGQGLDRKLTSLDRSPADVVALKIWSAREDLYSLKVWVEEPTGWQVRGVIPGGGMGARVVPLDLSRARGEQVRIRLQPPAGFWAINSVAIDYSPEQRLEVSRIAPQSARTSAGEDVLSKLQFTDGLAYKAVMGDDAEIAFPATPPRPGMRRTVFLHSAGYYRPDVRSQRPPDTETLRQVFETPDGLARFAARRYAAWRAAVPGS
ncbi:MAG TPA: hypothetical protein VGR73_05680 [Bryobacteraceae bacterium]|nr:hypothetical protein [Bryobacteraceae bacterium]